MPKLPRISGKKAVKAFQRAGWEISRQRGSHVVLTKKGSIYTISIPQHKELGPGLLRSLLRKAEIGLGEFIELV
ncbi:MAG: type II toxin-antitoxin system HicA family toxin [Candidatus Marinimicrobia bacterium]|nr:type II toxin-antitoxin system HicA family toxin [Candidatus Neomarinimicrobiota bacterium]